MSDLARAALAYAARGWHVFPCRPRGKPPHGRLAPHGFYDATTDLEQVKCWWGVCPQANVGVATGAVSNLVVVDVDGDRGRGALLQFQRHHGRLPETLWAKTRPGRWHAFFAHPGIEVSNSTSGLGPDLDVRGDGGYAILAPSVHPDTGQPYRWHDPAVEPASVPAWLLRLLRPAPGRMEHRPTPPSVPKRLEALVRFVASQPEGNRNASLYWAARRSLEEGHAPDEAAPLLIEAARACGLKEREAIRTIRSALTRTS